MRKFVSVFPVFPPFFRPFPTTVHSASLAPDYQQGQQAMSIFTGAVIHGGQFNISISSLKGCSTTHLPIHLFHHWLSSDTQCVIIRACTIDFSKALDLIDHNIIIITKLQLLGVPDILINWCADFLCQRYFHVKISKNKSAWKSTHAGVPQGTKLGPLLLIFL